MKWNIARSFLISAALGALACDTPVQPPRTVREIQPSLDVVDGANNGGDAHFFFLPPLVKDRPPAGTFDPRRAPVVEVCELDGAVCAGDPVVRFTTADGPPAEEAGGPAAAPSPPKPHGDKPKPHGDKQKPHGDKQKPHGDKPKPHGDKPKPHDEKGAPGATDFHGPADGSGKKETIRVFSHAKKNGVQGFYRVRWDLKRYDLDPTRVYRIRVLVDGDELGHADVQVVEGGHDWKEAVKAWKADPSNVVIPVRAKKKLSIAFRIDEGAVAEAPPAPWPHEPADLTVMTDQPWNDLNTMGWHHLDRSATSYIATDATAPLSPTNVLEELFPGGQTFQGQAPAVDYYGFGLPGVTEVYVGLWFKTSDSWQGALNGYNDIEALRLAGGGWAWLSMNGPATGPFTLRVSEEWPGGQALTSNVGDGTVTPGTWHRIELHLRYDSSPGSGDGVIQWWIDGTLVGDYGNRSFPADDGFTEYEITPTWTGTKAETEYFRYDHTYISGN